LALVSLITEIKVLRCGFFIGILFLPPFGDRDIFGTEELMPKENN